MWLGLSLFQSRRYARVRLMAATRAWKHVALVNDAAAARGFQSDVKDSKSIRRLVESLSAAAHYDHRGRPAAGCCLFLATQVIPVSCLHLYYACCSLTLIVHSHLLFKSRQKASSKCPCLE